MSICLGQHWFAERTFTGRGRVGGYRYCINCPREETLLYDYKENEFKWIYGRWTSTVEHYFIFAESFSAFQEKKNMILKESRPTDGEPPMITWVASPNQFSSIEKVRDPICVLAKDWLELDLIHDYRFARLFEIGHL